MEKSCQERNGMGSNIDKYNARLVKMQKIQNTAKRKGENTDKSENKVSETAINSALNTIGGKTFIDKAEPPKNDGFIFDIISNSLSFGGEFLSCCDYINYENSFFVINDKSLADMSENEVTNTRRSYLTNNLERVNDLVKQTLEITSKTTANKFYVLPDNTDFFAQPNIKAGFSDNYRFIWRSIAAAYHYYSDSKEDSEISVIDLFETEPARISIKAEYSDKYKAAIFTRVKKEPLQNLNTISFKAIAEGFWSDFSKKCGVNIDVKKIALSKESFDLLCRGQEVTVLFNDVIYKITASSVNIFLKSYLSENKIIWRELSGCIVYGDHIGDYIKKTNPAHDIRLLIYDNIGNSLEQFKYRANNNIPLWLETLPKLALQRIAVKGRLGEYTLVEDNKTVQNTFAKYEIKCPEKLTLPPCHEVVKFPLTISGISNKHFIARVELDEALISSEQFDVKLKYDFNNENSYEFILTQDEKTYTLTIEEGEPEKQNIPFKLEMPDNNAIAILNEIQCKLTEILQFIRQRNSEPFSRPTKKTGEKTERKWEFNARKTCNNIFSLWLGISYTTRHEKASFIDDSLRDKIIDEINKAYSDTGDNIDKCYVALVHAALALLSSCDFNMEHYNYFIENRKDHQFLEYAFPSKLLCNPTFDSELINYFLDSCKGGELIRTFSLPLLANDALLDYICENKREWLNKAAMNLNGYFERLQNIIQRSNATSLKTYVREIRDGYEFTLGLLKLRGTKYWNTVKNIENLLPVALNIEQLLYEKLSKDAPEAKNFVDLYAAQNWRDKSEKIIDNNILLSRITFDGNDEFKELPLMHPLALTAITYLEGNPDIHIIGCGLKDEVE
jgi:hypothetical protein